MYKCVYIHIYIYICVSSLQIVRGVKHLVRSHCNERMAPATWSTIRCVCVYIYIYIYTHTYM